MKREKAPDVRRELQWKNSENTKLEKSKDEFDILGTRLHFFWQSVRWDDWCHFNACQWSAVGMQIFVGQADSERHTLFPRQNAAEFYLFFFSNLNYCKK